MYAQVSVLVNILLNTEPIQLEMSNVSVAVSSFAKF